MGKADKSSRVTLQAGTYRYPFNVQLPPTLPSSFEGGVGYVRYTAEARIDLPWKFDDVTRCAFTVVGLIDLNKQPAEYKQGFSTDTEGKVSCCCWNGGHVTATLRLNRRCFVPGDTIMISAEITNHTTKKVSKVALHLMQHNLFIARGGATRAASYVRGTIERNQELKPGATDTWNNVAMLVPALPPTMLGGGCKIIEVSYILQLVASAKCTNVNLPANILVGTVPLQQANQGPAMSASYAPVLNGGVSIREEGDTGAVQGNMTFSPMYPYYGPAQPSAPGQ